MAGNQIVATQNSTARDLDPGDRRPDSLGTALIPSIQACPGLLDCRAFQHCLEISDRHRFVASSVAIFFAPERCPPVSSWRLSVTARTFQPAQPEVHLNLA